MPVSAGAFQHGENVKAARLLKTEAKRLSRSPLTTSRFAARVIFSLAFAVELGRFANEQLMERGQAGSQKHCDRTRPNLRISVGAS